MKIILECESVQELKSVFAQLTGGLVSEECVTALVNDAPVSEEVQEEVPKKKRGKKGVATDSTSPASPEVEAVKSDTVLQAEAEDAAPKPEPKAAPEVKTAPEPEIKDAAPLDATVGIKQILSKFGQKDGITKARSVLSKFLAAKASDLKPEQIAPFLEECGKVCA